MSRPEQPPKPAAHKRIRLTARSHQASYRGRIAGLIGVGVLTALALVTTVLPGPNQTPAQAADRGAATKLRLGYFANLTHAPALIADSEGLLDKELQGDGTTVETQIFNAGPAAIEALNSGAIDAAYLGPSPALNSFLSSAGTSVNIVSGASFGGASLVVRDGITDIKQLAGTELATPQFGGTQDVALRHFLAEQQLTEQVTVSPTSNSTITQLFARGAIDGAWVPEPYASLLIENSGAHRLVNEAELWPEGKFPTTVLVVSQQFLKQHPQTVAKLVEANTQAISWLNSAGEQQKVEAVQQGLIAANGSTFDKSVISLALKQVHFSQDPLVDTYQTLIDHAQQVGIGSAGSAQSLVDSRFLEEQER